jgi:hypothetical protein
MPTRDEVADGLRPHSPGADEIAAALPIERRSCPCLYVDPCRPSCTCASSWMSGGCDRCCTFGSLEQRKAIARHLAASSTAAERAATLEIKFKVPEGAPFTFDVRPPGAPTGWMLGRMHIDDKGVEWVLSAQDIIDSERIIAAALGGEERAT